MPVIEKYPISYVLVWRNARERENHYYLLIQDIRRLPIL